MENLLYVYVVIFMVLWVSGIVIAAIILHAIRSKNQLTKPKFWVENTKWNQQIDA